MSDTQEQQPHDSGRDSATGIDLVRVERVIGRVAGLAVIGGLAGYMVLMGGRAPVGLVLGLVGVFALGKLVVLALGVWQKWDAWPAVLLELFAFAAVAFVVFKDPQQSHTVLAVIAVALLLMSSAVVRRRARTRAASTE